MKIWYNRKTDYLEVFFKSVDSYYESSELSHGFITVFCDDNENDIVGYGIDEAFLNLSKFDKFNHKQKLALYSWMIRKKHKLTQEELSERISTLYSEEGMSLSTLKRIENGKTVAPYYYPIELKKIEPEFDLNFIA